jgi:hypothetical protein
MNKEKRALKIRNRIEKDNTNMDPEVGPGIAQSVQRLAAGWTVCGIESRLWARFSASVQTGPGAPPSLLYNGYRVPFPGVKRPGRGVDHPLHLEARLKKVYSYTSTLPAGPCGLLQGDYLSFFFVDLEENVQQARVVECVRESILLNTAKEPGALHQLNKYQLYSNPNI